MEWKDNFRVWKRAPYVESENQRVSYINRDCTFVSIPVASRLSPSYVTLMTVNCCFAFLPLTHFRPYHLLQCYLI